MFILPIIHIHTYIYIKTLYDKVYIYMYECKYNILQVANWCSLARLVSAENRNRADTIINIYQEFIEVVRAVMAFGGAGLR